MVSNEVWMGSGTSVTMAYESDLFLGYMNPGPTMGLTGTKEANYVRYNVGYEDDGSNSSATSKEFSDYYELVPDLYTGCTAEFYYTEGTGNPTLQMTAMVAGNDKTGIYFAGQKADYPSCLFNTGSASPSNPRGYIILKGRGATIPAPISMRRLNGADITADDLTEASINVATTFCDAGDRLYNQDNALIGVIHTNNGTDITFSATTTTTLSSLVAPALGKQTFTASSSLIGTLQAGDAFTLYLNSKPLYMGQVLGISDDGTVITTTDKLSNQTTLTCTTTDADATVTTTSTADLRVGMTVTGTSIQSSTTILSITDATTFELSQNADSSAASGLSLVFATPTGTTIYKGSGALVAATEINVPHIRTLSDNWIGLTNSITPPNVEVETKQVNLALAGTRNWTYQYKGLETAGEASVDVNLNHGSWLYYALGNISSLSCSTESAEDSTSCFRIAEAANTSKHDVWAGYSGLDADDYNTDGHNTLNGKFHRVLKNSQVICPPMLPFNGARKLTVPDVTNGVASNLITYSFTERNDATLPSFSLELTQEKGSNLGSIPMRDANTYNETVYSQLYPGCMVNSFTFSANENEEVKSTLSLNVKRVFETPNNYVSKAYDATNNDTTEFKRLFNFGQLSGADADCTEARHSFIDPFYFSDGTISLFGADFMKVSSMSLTISNGLTDKRYVGQYNKQIKHVVPAQRTYELTMQALVTDRRIFDELRRQSPHRFALNAAETDNTKHALIQLLFTKDNGESIKLQFDDYMISANTWPIPDDKGVIMVDFTIMPIRIGTMEAISSWVIQS